jgi:hypothetical protein
MASPRSLQGKMLDFEMAERVVLAAEAKAFAEASAKRQQRADPEQPTTPSPASDPAVVSPPNADAVDGADAANKLPLLATALKLDEVVSALVDAIASDAKLLRHQVVDRSGGTSFVVRSAVDCVLLLLLHDADARRLVQSDADAQKCALFVLLMTVMERIEDAFIGLKSCPSPTPQGSILYAIHRIAESVGKQKFRDSSESAAFVKAARTAHRITSQSPPNAELASVVLELRRVVAASMIVEILCSGALLQSCKLFARL